MERPEWYCLYFSQIIKWIFHQKCVTDNSFKYQIRSGKCGCVHEKFLDQCWVLTWRLDPTWCYQGVSDNLHAPPLQSKVQKFMRKRVNLKYGRTVILLMVNIINKKNCEAQQVQIVTGTEACYTVGEKLQGKASGSAAAQCQCIRAKGVRKKHY